MRLQTPRLLLRELKAEDAEPMARILSNPEVVRYIPLIDAPFPLELAKIKIHLYQSSAKRDPRIRYDLGIDLKEQDRFIGLVTLDSYEEEEGNIYYWLDQKKWNQGIMTEAVLRVMRFAFEKAGLETLNIEVLEENTASNCLATKLGFQQKSSKSSRSLHGAMVNKYLFLSADWQQAG